MNVPKLHEKVLTDYTSDEEQATSHGKETISDSSAAEFQGGFIENNSTLTGIQIESEAPWDNASTSRMIVLDPDSIQDTKDFTIDTSNKARTVKKTLTAPASKSRWFNKTKVTKYIKPPYQNKSFESSNELIYTLIQDIAALRSQIKKLSNNIMDPTAIVDNAFGSNYTVKKTFAEEFNLQIHFKTLQDFKSFDEKLRTENECNSRFKASLMLLLDKEGFILKSVTNMIRRYLPRELCMQFTAVKRVARKELFKEYIICSCILAIVCEKYGVTEDEVLSHLGIVFSNSKDWNGNRR